METQEQVSYFDLILVYSTFRKHETYMNIVKALAQTLSIGIFMCQAGRKWQETEYKVIEMYQQLGATLVEGQAECKVLFLPRFGKGRFKEYFEDLPQRIQYKNLFVQTGTLMEGVLSIKEICENLGKPTLLVPSIKHFGLYEKGTLNYLKQNPLELVEVGQPFLSYPVFEDFKADYLVAYPSHVSIVNSFQHYCLVKNITSVLFSLPQDAKIFVKPHNVRDKGNRISTKLSDRKLFSIFNKINFPTRLIQIALKSIYLFDFRYRGFYLFKYFPKKILNLIIGVQNDYIFSRCINLLKHYPAFGIEHFLRGVSKGVITGLSNTIFVALMHKVPIYICDPFMDERSANYQTMIREFGIDRWEGFSTEGFDLIDDSTRNADLIKYLETYIRENQLETSGKN